MVMDQIADHDQHDNHGNNRNIYERNVFNFQGITKRF